MNVEKNPKWDIGVAISQGKKAQKLAEDYRSAIEARLKPDELAQLGLNVQELERCRPGQQENLVNQKSKTEGQNTSIKSLHRSVTSLRNMVKCDNVSGDILKAYGVGEKIPKTVTGAVAAANMIVSAYNTYTDWSNNEAGIVEEDITRLTGMVTALTTAENQQGNAMFTRKSKTMDKNVLQRTVENTVTKISAIGVHVFMETDPAVAVLFDDLIPSSPKATGNGTANETQVA